MVILAINGFYLVTKAGNILNWVVFGKSYSSLAWVFGCLLYLVESAAVYKKKLIKVASFIFYSMHLSLSLPFIFSLSLSIQVAISLCLITGDGGSFTYGSKVYLKYLLS